MTNEYLPFGRDLDEIAMTTDGRTIKQRAIDWIKEHVVKKQFETFDLDDQMQPQEPQVE